MIEIDLRGLVNENIALVNPKNGKSVAIGCVEKVIRNSQHQQIIYLYNNKTKYLFKNYLIQYLIL